MILLCYRQVPDSESCELPTDEDAKSMEWPNPEISMAAAPLGGAGRPRHLPSQVPPASAVRSRRGARPDRCWASSPRSSPTSSTSALSVMPQQDFPFRAPIHRVGGDRARANGPLFGPLRCEPGAGDPNGSLMPEISKLSLRQLTNFISDLI